MGSTGKFLRRPVKCNSMPITTVDSPSKLCHPWILRSERKVKGSYWLIFPNIGSKIDL